MSRSIKRHIVRDASGELRFKDAGTLTEEDELVKPRGWVSVDDGTPKEGQEVRIHYKIERTGGDPDADDWMSPRYFTDVVIYHDGNWIGTGGQEPWHNLEYHEVTVLHWHTLPDPPEQE